MEVIRSFVTAGHVVIAGSGCGIPLIRENHHLVGVDAVIDKDWASELLARELNIDVLFILTAVDQVAIDFWKTDAPRPPSCINRRSETIYSRGTVSS